MQYIIIGKGHKDFVNRIFKSKKEAEEYFETEGMDYDFYKIITIKESEVEAGRLVACGNAFPDEKSAQAMAEKIKMLLND